MAKNYSKKLQKFIKNLDSKQKIYIGIGLFLFLLQYAFTDFTTTFSVDIRYFIIFPIMGIVYSFKRRKASRKLIKDKSLTEIVINDYSFSSYASLSILSLIYSIFQGALLGSTIGFLFYGVGELAYIIKDGEGILFSYFGYAIGSLFLLVITRVIIEAFTLIFRVAEDISKAVNKQNI